MSRILLLRLNQYAISLSTGRCRRTSSFSTLLRNDGNANSKPKAIFLNASRLNYDGKLDFNSWYDVVDVVLHDADRVDDVATVLELVQGAEIVITKEMPLPASTFLQFPNSVKLLCEAGTGYNNLPILEARTQNVAVCNTPTYSTDAVAHMAITYLLNFSVSMFQQQHMLRCEKDRSNFTGPFTLPLHEVNGKVLGLIGGSGRIGSTVAKIALALGMSIVISSRSGRLPDDHDLKNSPNVSCTSDVSFLLLHSDYVSLHTPLNDETRGTFGRVQIEQMKSTAFFINTSRGGVCNEAELIECLREQRIAGAGLDVTTTEPPSVDSPLWSLRNVYLSPHTGWRRLETRQRLVEMTADNIRAYCHASTPSDYINAVN
jgi:glycerate dehydrogenase